MNVVVLQSNYIPWKGYFDLIHDADVFVYYDEVQYTKNDWRNRNRICSKNGLQWLTVPIPKDAVKGTISQAEIVDKFWQEAHFKSLYFSYKPAQYFHQLEPMLVDTYQGRTWSSLSELNRYLIESISKSLGLTTKFIDSKDYELSGDKVERLIGLLKQVGATTYISGPAGKNYLSDYAHLFDEQNIQLLFKSYDRYPEYPQLSAPFTHAVSILDMIANISLSEIPNYIWNT